MNDEQKIKGYRNLTQDEIDLINQAKDLAEKVGAFTDILRVHHSQTANMAIDIRWLSIATTDLQKGFMSLIRSIAQPTTF